MTSQRERDYIIILSPKFRVVRVSGEMEVSVIGSAQAKIGKAELAYRELGICGLSGGRKVISEKSRVSFGRSMRWRKSGIRFALKAIQSEPLRSEKVSGQARTSKSVSFFPFFFASRSVWLLEKRKRKMVKICFFHKKSSSYFIFLRLKILFFFPIIFLFI